MIARMAALGRDTCDDSELDLLYHFVNCHKQACLQCYVKCLPDEDNEVERIE